MYYHENNKDVNKENKAASLDVSWLCPKSAVVHLLDYDCCAMKYADDTTVLEDNEDAYQDEVKSLVSWCNKKSLVLDVGKAKEIIVHFRKGRLSHTPLCTKDSTMERVNSIKFLSVQLIRRLLGLSTVRHW